MSAYAWPLVVLVLGLAALRMAWLLLDERREMREAVQRYAKALGLFREQMEAAVAGREDALKAVSARVDALELKAGLEREGL